MEAVAVTVQDAAAPTEVMAAIAAEVPLPTDAGAPGPSDSYDLPVAEGKPAGAVGDDEDDDDDEDDGPPRKKRGGHGRRKIEIEYIEDKIRRHITFSKRKAGISKKAYELSRLTGAQVLLLISSERGQIYSFATPKLQPILVNENSKQLIEQCLNAPDPMALPPAPMPLPPDLAQMPPQPPPQQPGMVVPHMLPAVSMPAGVDGIALGHPSLAASHLAAAGYLVGGAEVAPMHGMMPQ